MTEQREDLGCDAVITRASANPTGSSGAGMALQNCPALGRGDWTFIPFIGLSLGAGCPWR